MTNIDIAYAGFWGPSPDRGAAADVVRQAAHFANEGVSEIALSSPIVLALLALGIALWLVGDRLFRPASSLLGAGLGAAIGLAASSAWTFGDVGAVPAPYLIISLCALVGLAVGALMYRLAIGASAGVALAGLAAGIAAAITLSSSVPGTDNPAAGALSETLQASASAEAPRVIPASLSGEISLEAFGEAATSAGRILGQGWETLPEGPRNLITAAAILGCVAGLAFGVIRPRLAGPVIAALTGAGIWLAAITMLLAGAGRELPPMPAEAPAAWLFAWLGAAFVGFLAQRRVLGQMFRPQPEH